LKKIEIYFGFLKNGLNRKKAICICFTQRDRKTQTNMTIIKSEPDIVMRIGSETTTLSLPQFGSDPTITISPCEIECIGGVLNMFAFSVEGSNLIVKIMTIMPDMNELIDMVAKLDGRSMQPGEFDCVIIRQQYVTKDHTF
jgi:hypothetical protein